MASETALPEGITESEYSEIQQSVEAILTGRGQPEADRSPVENRRRGLGMVVILNLSLLLALAAAVALYVRFAPRAAPEVNPFSGEPTTSAAAIVAEVQQQNRDQLSEREREIAAIERELAELRSQTPAERESAGTQTRARELEEALVALNATSAERLSAIERDDQQIAFLSNQLSTVYQEMRQAIADANFERARELVARAGELTETAPFRSNALLRSTAGAVSAANQVLAAVIPLAEEDAAQLAAVGSRLEEAASLVSQADARFEAGELENAESLYRSAIRSIDAAERATGQLLLLEGQRLSRAYDDQIDDLRATLSRTRSNVGSLQSQVRTLEQTRAELRERVTQLEDELTRAQSQLAATRAQSAQGPDEAEIDVQPIQRAIDEAGALATARLPETARADREDEVVDLLGTRVLLRAVVNSAAVQDQYPSLYEDMETYFEALSEARIDQGAADAYQTASEAIATIAERMGTSVDTTTEPTTARGVIERVVALVQATLEQVSTR